MSEHYYTPYAPQYGQPQPSKALGITSMVLGIVAVVLAFIPFIGLLSYGLGIAAVVLGILALNRPAGRGQGLTGLITGGVSLLIVTLVTLVTSWMFEVVEDEVERIERQDPVEQSDEEVTTTEADDEDEEEGQAGPVNVSMGETVTVYSSSSDEALHTMTMNDVTPNFLCTTDYYGDIASPDSGGYLAIDLTIAATDDASSGYQVREQDFSVVDEDGELTDFDMQGLNTRMCLNDTDRVQDVRPGTNSTGLIVFDTAVASGTLIYEGGPGEIRWEF